MKTQCFTVVILYNLIYTYVRFIPINANRSLQMLCTGSLRQNIRFWMSLVAQINSF